jgi:hypothetical protein
MAGLSTVRYQYPNGPKVPTQAQMEKDFTHVRALVTIAEDGPPVDIVHNMQLDPDAPIEALQIPIVHVNAVAGAGAPVVVTVKDENTVTLSKAAAAGSATTYEVSISRHGEAKAWKAEKPKTSAAGGAVQQK